MSLSKLHWRDSDGEPFCRRVPRAVARTVNYGAMVSCKRCIALLAEVEAAIAKAEGR
jgi:hypothetical protein